MAAKKILMLTGDYTEDYETMVPFRAHRPHASRRGDFARMFAERKKWMREIYGERAAWVDYIRPGFTLSKKNWSRRTQQSNYRMCGDG